jgi:hypothetical protein
MAAEAIDQATPMGESVQIGIISRKQKSPLYGAQYLHSPIPYMTNVESRTVRYRLQGSPLGYRQKVYGEDWTGTVSPEDLTNDHWAWDIRATYDALWDKWGGSVSDLDITPYSLKQVIGDIRPDIVVSSIPARILCEGGDSKAHFFNQVEVWAAGDAPDIGIDIGKIYQCADEMVVCDGTDNSAWYRKSRVFGHTTVEWPGYIDRVPVRTASRVAKPLNNNCDCFPSVMRVGRYGKWEKGVLSDSAYHDTHSRMEELWAQAALF